MNSAAATAPAISKAYNFASTWEKNAPLTEAQQAAVTALGHAVAERPLPSHVKVETPELEFNEQPRAPTLTEVILLNSHQFYKWYSDLESALKSETEEKYRLYVNSLNGHLGTCDNILGQLDGTLHLFDDLQEQHQAVKTKTKSLHDACDRLVVEKDRLAEFADALRSKLSYFDELEHIATQFYAPSMNVSNENFLSLLKRLDECITYVGSNPQYADSNIYLVKFKQLQTRALGMVRSHVFSVLKSTSAQVQAAMKESTGGNGKVVMSEGMETSVLYVRFKAAASELQAVLQEIESRAKRKEYAQILADCQTAYFEHRIALVHGVVQQRISEYAKKESLPSFTRSGCAYLMQVCQHEHQLFDHFFPSACSEASVLTPLTESLCTCLYDALRPKFIQETSLDLLCELVGILKFEVLEEQLGRRGEPVVGLRPIISRILADVQERLTFRVQTYIRNEVANYLPLAEDLDYPGKLERAAAAGAEDDKDSTIYPPLDKTLNCLAKLYRCVEPEIFTGLAQESVSICSAAIQRVSKLVAKKSSQMDGQLFLIKHLLILREQIAPFDIDFAVTHKELDFAHVLDHLRRILRGQASLFDLTSRSTLARTFSPRVLESQVDAKKELEKSLKTTCEQFIMSVTKLAVEPMLSFITKVTAAASSISLGGKALKEQAFATREKVAEMVAKVENSLREELPVVVSKMKLYLHNSSTQSILFKPIKSNIVEAHSQVVEIVKNEYGEDAELINVTQHSQLLHYLDGLC